MFYAMKANMICGKVSFEYVWSQSFGQWLDDATFSNGTGFYEGFKCRKLSQSSFRATLPPGMAACDDSPIGEEFSLITQARYNNQNRLHSGIKQGNTVIWCMPIAPDRVPQSKARDGRECYCEQDGSVSLSNFGLKALYESFCFSRS